MAMGSESITGSTAYGVGVIVHPGGGGQFKGYYDSASADFWTGANTIPAADPCTTESYGSTGIISTYADYTEGGGGGSSIPVIINHLRNQGIS